MDIVFPGLVALIVALGVTPVVRWAAWKMDVVDAPSKPRKRHGREVPLLGGVAVLIALAAGVGTAIGAGIVPDDHIKAKFLIGLVAAAAVLVFGGAWDDAKDLKPLRQLAWPILAILIIIASGIGISFITNPLGGQFDLDRYSWTVLWFDGLPYKLTLIADLFTFAWLMGTTYTTKLLDGLDGLVSGVTVIGAGIIAAVSLSRDVAQPDTAALALIVAGAFLGFFFFNASPATIFLGEGGSTLAGFLLGLLAIISGGKIATALLILGLPIIDVVAVIFGRLIAGRPIARGDRTHLHLRLVDLGLTPAQTTLFYCFIAALFGASTLVLRGVGGVAAVGLLSSILLAATAVLIVVARRR